MLWFMPGLSTQSGSGRPRTLLVTTEWSAQTIRRSRPHIRQRRRVLVADFRNVNFVPPGPPRTRVSGG